MKKALIAIISVIYVVAIIIVSFLGIRAEVVNETIYVQEIVLLNQTLYYPNMPKIEDNAIVSVYKRPSEDAIGDDGSGLGELEDILDALGRCFDVEVHIEVARIEDAKVSIDTLN